MSWSTKWRWDTGYSADSVEWCPVAGYGDLLACGTYQLDKSDGGGTKTKQTRLGRIYLFTVNSATTELAPIQTIDTTGILDQKWCYHEISDHPVLAVATSDGKLRLYRLVKGEDHLKLEFWMEHSIGQDMLALSLDWSTNKSKGDDTRIVVSDSSGRVSVVKINQSVVEKVREWKGHEFEAWIAAFDYWNTNVFYSGGDDCVFKSYDTRSPEVAAINRSHETGVTAIRSHVDVEHQLITGSYDERVRLWDARSLKRCVTEANLYGGIWRLKWCPYKPDHIIAACMYGGFRVVKLQGTFQVVSEYMEHESIAYGADWKFDEQRPLVATCSFYDCKLHVCEVVL